LVAGQATIFPQGLIHEEHNLGCEPATFISAFSNEDAGALQIVNRLFTLPQEALAATFSVSNSTIDSLRSGLLVNPARGTPECLARCAQLRNQRRSTTKSPVFTK